MLGRELALSLAQAAKAKEIAAAATPGPWTVLWLDEPCVVVDAEHYDLYRPDGDEGEPENVFCLGMSCVRSAETDANARFLAESRTMVPILATAVERLAGEMRHFRKSHFRHADDHLLLLHGIMDFGESLKGRQVPADRPWHVDVAAFIKKMFYHGTSLFHLSCSSRLPDEFGQPVAFLDIASMGVVLRSMLETHLAFHYLFLDSSDLEVAGLRHLVWRLNSCRYLRRAGFFTEAMLDRQIERDKEEVALLAEVQGHPHYARLMDFQQKHACKGEWRYELKNISYPELAVLAGFDREWAEGAYSWLSAYTHAGEQAMGQLDAADDLETQASMVRVMGSYTAVVLGHFLQALVRLFPGAQLAEPIELAMDVHGWIGTPEWKKKSTVTEPAPSVEAGPPRRGFDFEVPVEVEQYVLRFKPERSDAIPRPDLFRAWCEHVRVGLSVEAALERVAIDDGRTGKQRVEMLRHLLNATYHLVMETERGARIRAYQEQKAVGKSRKASGPGQQPVVTPKSQPAVLPVRALSVRQPYAHLILEGRKTIEMRSQATSIRGPVMIYAAKTLVRDAWVLANIPDLDLDTLPRGVILGQVDIVGCRAITDADTPKVCSEVGGESGYAWLLERPVRYDNPIPAPAGRQPMPVFWKPFV